MLEAIETRISRRSFEPEPLTEAEMNQINSYLRELNEVSHLTMELLEDGSKAFSSLKKSYGIFTNVRSLILMKGSKDDLNLKEKVGYYGEELMLRLTQLKLGTCWVGGTFDVNQIAQKESETLVCVMVVGKVKEPSLKEKMVRSAISKKRKAVQERLRTDQDHVPEWILKGIEAVRLAPSAKNSQKVFFQYQNEILTAHVADREPFDLVDLGIAKKHFELGANGTFELGNHQPFQYSKTK